MVKDYEEMYYELLDIVHRSVSKNPTSIDSSLVEYTMEKEVDNE